MATVNLPDLFHSNADRKFAYFKNIACPLWEHGTWEIFVDVGAQKSTEVQIGFLTGLISG